ncbi:MAG TPA: carboxypeptidase regulatory-like domain-containing protein [Pyrinomonadaceae bacterium]|nr:carboxypeptidase regulatory-like domain-containing protein [Pyrinomonadaceae bacterium]
MSLRSWMQASLLLLCVGLLVGVYAQSATTGNITGTVRDPQGAAVPKAEVTITEEKTGVSRMVRATEDGFYTATSLPAGVYTISTSPAGFKKTISSGVELHVNENKTVNLDLQVGQVTETVTVTSETAPVELRSGEVSSLITEKQVTELPLNGRNYAQLALMVPGVSPVTQSGAGGAFATRGTGLNAGVDMSVNGNQSNSNLWTVDGVNNMDVGSNRTLLVFPSIDSIQEFRVERNSFSAEFGQAQGAVVNLITKGGSNEFHGGLFEFFRNDALNANNFFLNRSGQPKPQLEYNNFGGNFSGPIVKNRVFFFWSEEWRRERRGQVLSSKVPTAAEKAGDFSAFTIQNGRRVPLLTGPTQRLTPTSDVFIPVLPHFPGMTCDSRNELNVGPNPVDPGCFPGNRIPQAQLSPGGLAFMKLFPNPTGPGISDWATSTLQPIDTRQDSIRGDITINDRTNLMVRYINEKWDHKGASGNFWGDSAYPTIASDWSQPSHSFAVKLTNTITSKAVNEFQFSIAGNDIIITTSPETQALEDEIAGAIPTVFPKADGDVGGAVPSLFWGVDGYSNIWHQAPWANREDLYIWKDDFSLVKGSHEWKFGGIFSHNFKDEPGVGGAGGNQQATIQGCGSQTGTCIGDLLLRNTIIPDYQEIANTEIAEGRWRDFEFYANDTWKLHPRVTLTMGLRYSVFTPAWEKDNRISNFLPSLYNGLDFNTGLVTAEEGIGLGLGRSLVNTYKKGWQPRVGLAWDVYGTGKTAVRAGFGRYMSRSNVIEDLLRLTGNPPWTTTVRSTNGTSLATCNTCRSLDTINPGVANNVAGVDPNAGFNAVDPNFRPPESYQWNLTISHQLFKDTVLEASYIGNHGLHIWRRNVNRNDIAPDKACFGPACDGSSRSARVQIARAVLDETTADEGRLIADNRLFRGIGNVTTDESNGNSSYHAMQLWLNRRFTERLAFQAAYTWGHAISDVALTSFTNTTSDPFNFGLDKGDADLDRRHTFVGNVVYVLPSFKSWGKAAELTLGDWQLNAIASRFGATPVDVTTGVNTVGTAAVVGQRPNYTGQPLYLDTNDSRLHLNPAAFARPAAGQLGTLGRGSVRGKPITNIDFSMAKNWRFRERYGFQFRAEFFNVFNHANFVGYDLDIRNSTFGQLNNTQASREIQLGLKFTF